MVEALAEGHDLCIGGDCFEMLLQTSAVVKVIPYVKVVTLYNNLYEINDFDAVFYANKTISNVRYSRGWHQSKKNS